jgi:hypothetical protein
VTLDECHAVVADFITRTEAGSARADGRFAQVDEPRTPALVDLPGEAGT